MLKRKIDAFLLNWKNDVNKKPLIIKGARQIGKTTSILEFAKNNYKYVVYINFALMNEIKELFNNENVKSYEVDDLIKSISFAKSGFEFVPNETLIFFDEIQEQPNCITSLKSFALDKRFDVICSGSLLGINFKEYNIRHIGVGYISQYEMKPMDFEEYLWAKGYKDEDINYLFKHLIDQKPFENSMLQSVFNHYDEFLVIGGLPYIIDKFLVNPNTKSNFGKVFEYQKELQNIYKDDFGQYLDYEEMMKVERIYDMVGKFLGRENKKFVFSDLNLNLKSKRCIPSIDWLKHIGVINYCYQLKNIEKPIKTNFIENSFKIYHFDTGMLISQLDVESMNDLRINKNFNTYNGALYENAIANSLYKQDFKLFYWKNNKGTAEVDFVVETFNHVIPIEVKANKGDSPSLNKFLSEFKNKNVAFGIKLSRNNIGFQNGIYTIPYFLDFKLKEFIKHIEKNL